MRVKDVIQELELYDPDMEVKAVGAKELPDKLQNFFDMLMKEARRNSLIELCESWDISKDELDECTEYIKEVLGIKL